MPPSAGGRIFGPGDPLCALLRAVRRVAVLGIRSEARAWRPAHYVPAYLAQAGLELIPVPVYEPERRQILGRPVVRSLRGLCGVDLVNVFRRAEDLPAHLDELLALRPRIVWLQQGIRDDAFAERLAQAGIDVVQDRCLMVEHRRCAAGLP